MTVVPRPRTVSPVSTAGPVPGPASTNDSESDVWPGVASTRSSQPAAATTSPSTERLGTQHQRRVQRPHRGPGQLREAPRAPRRGRGGGGSAGPARRGRARPPAPGAPGGRRRDRRPRIPPRRVPAAPRCWCLPASSARGWARAAPTPAASPGAARRRRDAPLRRAHRRRTPSPDRRAP